MLGCVIRFNVCLFGGSANYWQRKRNDFGFVRVIYSILVVFMSKEENLNLYNLELKKIREECKKQIKALADKSKAKMVSLYEDVLGEEYTLALEEGRRFAEKYKDLINVAFEYAAQGEGRELVMKISALSDNEEKDKKDKNNKAEIVNELLDRIMDYLEDDYPDLVSLIKHVQYDISANEEKISVMLKQNESELKDVREDVKKYFQKGLEEILYSFSQIVADMRKKYDVDADRVEKIEIDNVDEPDITNEESYLPFKKGKGTIN